MGTVVRHSRRFSREELHSSRGKDRKNGNREKHNPQTTDPLRQASPEKHTVGKGFNIIENSSSCSGKPGHGFEKGIGYRINASAKIKRKHAGKSYATGFLAREWNKNGHRTITQKFIQTGNVGHSEDIDLHRQIMGIPFTKEDQEGLTMPEIFSYPASPHLASQLDNRPIDFDKIKRATEELSERYDSVLLEGAGGLMVPLTTELLTIDYIVQEKYPLIFVTSGKLGSINHTLLSLEAIQKRGIVLDTVLYNLYPTVEDKTIQNDTMEFIRTWLKKYFPETKFILVPEIKKNL